MRQVCLDFSIRAAPHCFGSIACNFTTSSLTKPSRMAALDRIGQYVQSFRLNLPYSLDTVLPPLVDPWTGQEKNFVYTPQTHTYNGSDAGLRRSQYGDSETTDLLVRQYPPLFHAATNVSSFRQLLSSLTNLKHLTIRGSKDGFVPHLDHRNTSDFALVSLRAVLEQDHLPHLTELSVTTMHASALRFLQPTTLATWCARIESLELKLYAASLTKDRIPDDRIQSIYRYLQCFSGIVRFGFGWIGRRGPLPISKPHQQELVNARRDTKYHPAFRPSAAEEATSVIVSSKLSRLTLANMETSADVVSHWLKAHVSTLHDLHLDDVKLSSGTWDQALEPLTNLARSNRWAKPTREIWDVPIMLGSDIAAGRCKPTAPHPKRLDSGVQMGKTSLARSQAINDESASPARSTVTRSGHYLPSSTRQCAYRGKDQGAVKQCRFMLPPDKPPTPPPKEMKRSLWGCKEVKKIFRGGILRWP